MDFWDVTKVMFRRWYIAVPLLLASVAATGYTAVAVKPDYALTAYVQLIPPVANSDDQAKTQRNPWLQLGLEALTDAANYATLDQTFLDDLAAKGESTNFSIEVGMPAVGATIEVIGSTRVQAEQTTAAILQHFDETVRSLQTQYNVKPADLITTHRLDRGENLKQRGGKVKRAIVVVAGMGALLTGGLTIAFDAIVRRRRRGKSPVAVSATRAVASTHFPPWYRNGSAVPVRQPVLRTDDTAVLPAATEPAVSQRDGTERRSAIDHRSMPSDVTIVLSMPRNQSGAGDNPDRRPPGARDGGGNRR